MPKITTTRDNHEFLSLDSLTDGERKAFDLAIAALYLPLTERQAWFTHIATEMVHANTQFSAS